VKSVCAALMIWTYIHKAQFCSWIISRPDHVKIGDRRPKVDMEESEYRFEGLEYSQGVSLK
jgi:hypothetical protein